MPFDAARYPDAVTFGWLIENGMDVGLHCQPCGRHIIVAVRSLPFAFDTPVPATAGRFKCTRCGIHEAAGVAKALAFQARPARYPG